jgi:hypothetical protein
MKSRALACLLLALAVSCDRAPTPDPAAKPDGARRGPAAQGAGPAFVADWDDLPRGAEWTAHVRGALADFGGPLLEAVPSDRAEYCPGFDAQTPLEREAFYVGLISRMARFESGFDPDTSFQESFTNSQGERVVSRGLLQLSHESANGYPNCRPVEDQELHDPATNLRCAVAILTRLVPRDATIGSGRAGGAAYWSVLRNTSDKRPRIVEYTRALEVCRPGP